jgi:hypothetical protein
MVDAHHFSLDFLPDVAGSWTMRDARGSLLLLRGHVGFTFTSPAEFPGRVVCEFPDMVVCEPLTRRYRSILPPPDWDNHRCYFREVFLLYGAGGNISMFNFIRS